MNKFLLTFILLVGICFQMTAQTVVWDGDAGDGLWMSPTNWDTDALPTMANDVDLGGSPVTLTANTQVQRVYAGGSSDFTIDAGVTLTITGFAGGDDGLEIQGSATVTNNGTIDISNITGAAADGLYCKGTFINASTGTVNVDGTGEYNIYVQGGNFTNNGIITLTNYGQSNTDRDGITVDDNSGTIGTLNNDAGSITITMTGSDDGIYVNDGCIFNNAAMITIGGAGGDNGIRVDDGASFNNNTGGTFTINSTPDDQLFLDNDGAFNNSGTVNLNNASDVGLYITDDGIFTNMMAGNLNVTDASNFSIQVDRNVGSSFTLAELVNDGTITTTNGSKDGIRLQEGGAFTNNSGGMVMINTPAEEGINIQSSGGTVTNSGSLTITGSGAGVSPGDNGIEIANTGSFSNMSGGTLTISNTFDKGILMATGSTVSNSGTIDISDAGEEGIDMNGGTFDNNTGALLMVVDCAGDNIEINGTSVVMNDGDVRASRTGADGSGRDDIEINGGATFTNTANATFAPGNSPGELEVRGDFDLGSSTVTFEINGTSHTSTYDRIETTNTATLTISSATAHLDWGSFVPSVGNCFTIVNGNSTVSGAFALTTTNASIILEPVDYSVAGEVIICVQAILPVELTSFEGKMESSTSLLSWETQMEENNDYFEVQYSTDGREFSTIDMVAGNGTTTEVQNYEYTHKNVRSLDNYYRLKQVDFDGEFAYSDIIYLKNDTRDTPVAIFPNPAFEEITYQGTAASLTFYDIQGRQVMQQIAQDERTTIDISRLKSGIYTIEILTNSGHKTFDKLIKE